MGLVSSYRDLNQKERIYVESRLKGMTQVASATAAGYQTPKVDCTRVEKKPEVQEALIAGMRETAKEVGFSRKEAHDMLEQAYWNADTAAEQIAAVRELIKLHGVAAPQQVEVNHTHKHEGELHLLPNDELMKLADMEGDLVLEGEYREIEEPERLEHLATDGENVPT